MVLLLDTETTGLDYQKDRIIELAVQITTPTGWVTIDEMGSFMWDASYPSLTDEISVLTGITMDDLLAGICTPASVYQALDKIALKYKPEMVVAYNAEFDESMFRSEVKRGNHLLLEGIHHLCEIPWVCAMKDLEMNYKEKCWRLSHLALEHGVAVNPKDLHRASDDVELMRKMLVATKSSAYDLLDFRNSPWVYLRAKTTEPWKDDGRSNALAKAHGYHWETPRGDTKKFAKSWVKRVKEPHVEKEMKAPFPVTRLQGD